MDKLYEFIHILRALESTYVSKFCNYKVNTRERLFCLRLRRPNLKCHFRLPKILCPQRITKVKFYSFLVKPPVVMLGNVSLCSPGKRHPSVPFLIFISQNHRIC